MKLEDIQNVTVLGTGMMGPGIALLFVQSGYPVTIWGPTEVDLKNGEKNFQQNIDDLVKEKIISSAEAATYSSYIRTTTDLSSAVR